MNPKTIAIVLVLALVGLGAYFLVGTTAATDTGPNPTQATTTTQSTPLAQATSTQPAITAAKADLAARLGISASSITVVGATAATWSDGCLGLGGIAESCLQALVPGYRIDLLAEGSVYSYRTDKGGSAVRAEPETK